MRRFKTLLFVVALFSFIPVVSAKKPILNIIDEPVITATEKPLSAVQVCELIQKTAKLLHWSVTKGSEGKLVASLSWKDKHMVVDIACSKNAYSIIYKHSINLKYTIGKHGPSVHSLYNRRIEELKNAIYMDALKI